MLRKVVLIILITGLAFSLNAGTTGKISGRITDADTGEPLVGANILIKGTSLGAAADIDGYYVILNVAPGKYTLQAMFIGYNTQEVSNVRVSIDLTAKINVQLSATTLETGETITIVAKREAIKNDLTATTAVIDDEAIETLPVTEVSEVLSLQAGYVDGHMRGGRAGEVAYWVDGIPVTDAYDGTAVVDVNKNMVQELQVVSGAFNAEYGNAMSGIVNIVTKEGSNKFGGSVNVYMGDYFSAHDKIFWGINTFNLTNIYNLGASLNGAIVKDKLFYYVNYRHIYFGGWYNGKDKYKPQNMFGFDSTGAFIPSFYESGRGTGQYVPMNWNRKNYAQAKLVYKVTPTVNLMSSTIVDNVNYQDYDRSYKLNPGGNLFKHRLGFTEIVKLTHVLSPTMFYDFGITGFYKKYEEYRYKDPHDPRYVHPTLNNTFDKSFKLGGDNMHRFNRETKTLLSKFNLTSQMGRNNEVKMGFEFKRHELRFSDITLQAVNPNDYSGTYPAPPYIITYIPDDSTTFASRYKYKPTEASVYIQDKLEFEDFILNIGVRFDYFDADGVVLSDPTDPQIRNPIKPENRYHDTNGNGQWDTGEPAVTLAEREAYWYKDSTPKYQFSPRVGGAFPISSTGKIYFSYGYFFQRPRFELLYENPDFDIPITGFGSFGNANLKPEKTIKGEIGIQQQLNESSTLDATIYFRDIRDLTGTSSNDRISLTTGKTYSKYVNLDFGLIKGFILALNSRLANGLATKIDYTYQVARGVASDPKDGHKAASSGQLPEIQMLPLSWDQRHTVNVSAIYTAGSWGGSIIGRYGSGLPYTPR